MNKFSWRAHLLLVVAVSLCVAKLFLVTLPAAADPTGTPPPTEAASSEASETFFRVTLPSGGLSSAPPGSDAPGAPSEAREEKWRVHDVADGSDASLPVLTIALAGAFAAIPAADAPALSGAPLVAPAQTATPGWGRRLTRWILGLVGATRWISASNALEQDTRQRVYHAVRRHPAIHAGALAAMLDLRRQTILYHLHVLTSEGLLTSQLSGRRRYYCNGDRARDDPRLGLGATAKRLLEELAEGPRTKDALADALGISPRGVAWHLRRLTESGVVRRTESRPAAEYVLGDLSRMGARPAAEGTLRLREPAACLPAA